MDKKSCTFAGHRTAPSSITNELKDAICKLIENCGVTTFYVGNNGSFDHLSAAAVRSIKKKYPNKSIKLIIVIPKMNEAILNNKDYYPKRFDEIIVPADSDTAHYKAMISVRNKWLVDNSDYIITYIRKEYGGAYTTFKYAKKINIEIIEL